MALKPKLSACRGEVGSSMAGGPETGTTPRDVAQKPAPERHAEPQRCLWGCLKWQMAQASEREPLRPLR